MSSLPESSCLFVDTCGAREWRHRSAFLFNLSLGPLKVPRRVPIHVLLRTTPMFDAPASDIGVGA